LKLAVFYLSVFIISGVLGYYSTLFSNLHEKERKKEEFIQKYLQTVEKTFDLHTLEVQGIAKLDYTEKDEHFFSYFTNPLFSKEYHFLIPFKATYGISLKNVKTLNFYQNKIYVSLPEAQLLTFDLELQNKKIFSKEGWLVFQKDDKFHEFEKKIYEKQKKELEENQKFKEDAKIYAQNQITELLKPLNLPIEFNSSFWKR